MTDREEIGGIENRHSEKKRKKIKNKKGKRNNIFEVNGSEISAKDYTLSKAVEGKKRKKQAGSKKEKTEEKNVPTRPRHDEGGMVYIKRKLGEKKKRRKREKVDSAEAENAFQAEIEEHVSSKAMDGKKSKNSPGKKKVKTHIESETEGEPAVEMLDNDFKIINGKSRKGKRKDKKAINQSGAGKELVEDKDESPKEEVYHISSEDEDSPKGMKKWVMEYHQSRPGLKILQQRIDEFIIAHEAKLEQDRKEREARAAEGGWTVVTHHKGRKKTTESETGTVVGSVSEAALRDQAAKKKQKEVGLDFYRFQKREAQRNEIMMLQSKFEQDKKRIQQLRAARKFRPY